MSEHDEECTMMLIMQNLIQTSKNFGSYKKDFQGKIIHNFYSTGFVILSVDKRALP